MRKKKFMAVAAAVAMAAITAFSVGNIPSVKAADVTSKTPIDLEINGSYEEKQISKADAKVINETLGYDLAVNNIIVCGDNATGYIDYDKSSVPFEKICDTYVFCPVLSRDENGKLVIAKDENGAVKAKKDSWGHIGWDGNTSLPAVLSSTGFSILSKEASAQRYSDCYINENLSNPSLENVDVTDVYIVRVKFTTDDGPNYTAACLDFAGIYTNEDRLNRTFGYVDFWILPEGVSTVLNFADETPEPTPSEDNYTVDLGNSQTISADTFAAILAENATKDVIIKSNNNVTFTFAKGTMTNVAGKTEYDFSTSINSTYSSSMPSYITSGNFVSQIKFNYSGQLPATANICIPVGTQYAGQTLYYSLMNEDNTFAEVQAVVVDNEGYITVKQSHCSSYVVTKTEPKSADSDNTNNSNTSNDNTANGGSSDNGNVSNGGSSDNCNVSDNGNTTTGDNSSTADTTVAPKTADMTPVAIYAVIAVAAMGAIVFVKRRKTA